MHKRSTKKVAVSRNQYFQSLQLNAHYYQDPPYSQIFQKMKKNQSNMDLNFRIDECTHIRTYFNLYTIGSLCGYAYPLLCFAKFGCFIMFMIDRQLVLLNPNGFGAYHIIIWLNV